MNIFEMLKNMVGLLLIKDCGKKIITNILFAMNMNKFISSKIP